ncbi:hypothetical protein BU23DRAFT_460915, partial [Bimuria novae-zelandiae CBS 107.79]
AKQIVCLDKSTTTKQTRDRKRGWAPKGSNCRVTGSVARTRRRSLLPATTIDSYIAHIII